MPSGPCVALVGTLPRHPYWWSDNDLLEPSSSRLLFMCAWDPQLMRLPMRALATAPKLQELAKLTLPRAAPDVSPPPFHTESHPGWWPFPIWGLLSRECSHWPGFIPSIWTLSFLRPQAKCHLFRKAGWFVSPSWWPLAIFLYFNNQISNCIFIGLFVLGQCFLKYIIIFKSPKFYLHAGGLM